MTVRTNYIGVSDWADGEILYSADLNDTFKATINLPVIFSGSGTISALAASAEETIASPIIPNISDGKLILELSARGSAGTLLITISPTTSIAGGIIAPSGLQSVAMSLECSNQENTTGQWVKYTGKGTTTYTALLNYFSVFDFTTNNTIYFLVKNNHGSSQDIYYNYRVLLFKTRP